MVYANELASDKKLKKAKEYYDDAIDNLISFQSDIQNQTFLGMFIFKSKKKNENINLEKKPTKISQQNERKKKF